MTAYRTPDTKDEYEDKIPMDESEFWVQQWTTVSKIILGCAAIIGIGVTSSSFYHDWADMKVHEIESTPDAKTASVARAEEAKALRDKAQFEYWSSQHK